MIDIVEPESIGLCSTRLERVSHWLEAQVANERLAGLSVLVGRHGKVAYFETAGQADMAAGQPFAKDTIVRIYSMTKPITTVAAMMLYEQGCFELDDAVVRYLPEFADLRVWAGGDAGIEETLPLATPMTVHHLLTHTSGLTYGFMHANVVDALYRDEQMELPGAQVNLQRQVSRLARIPLICQPGSAWNYSVSTDVLGRLVEIWSGLSLETFFQEHIFQPLDMRDAGFHVQPQNHARFAANYSPLSGGDMSDFGKPPAELLLENKPGGLQLLDPAQDSAFCSPAILYSGGGGLTASMRDYTRFCQMLMNHGELDGNRLLGRKTVEYMRQNHLPENKDLAAMGQAVWSETSYAGIGFGLGFAVVLDPIKAKAITSPGEHHWGGAASTFFWLDPEEDLFTILFTQLTPSSTYPLRRELRTLVYQALT